MLNSLQNLRALAAYSVVLYHCLIGYLHPTDALGRAYLDLPSGGVDLFFVISGFVMTHATRDDETPAWFLTKRIARIVPLYWAATFLVAAIVLLKPWVFPLTEAGLESVVTSLFFIPHVQPGPVTAPVLGVGWTLNYEMMFYALFALALALPKAFRLPGVIGLITAVWAAGMLGGDGIVARFYASPIVFEFAAGCIIANALRLPQVADFVRKVPMWPIALVGFAGFLTVPAVLALEVPSFFRLCLPAMLIVFAAAGQDIYRAPAKETFVTRLGDASYSAYLLHPIALAGFSVLGVALPGHQPLNFWIFTGGVMAVTAVISLVSMKYFERPTAALVRKIARDGLRVPARRKSAAKSV